MQKNNNKKFAFKSNVSLSFQLPVSSGVQITMWIRILVLVWDTCRVYQSWRGVSWYRPTRLLVHKKIGVHRKTTCYSNILCSTKPPHQRSPENWKKEKNHKCFVGITNFFLIFIYLPTYLPIDRSIDLWICVSNYLSIYLSIYLYLSVCLSIYRSVYLSVCHSDSVCVSLSLSLSVYTCLSVCLSINLIICVPTGNSVVMNKEHTLWFRKIQWCGREINWLINFLFVCWKSSTCSTFGVNSYATTSTVLEWQETHQEWLASNNGQVLDWLWGL